MTDAYELVEKHNLKDLNSEGYIYRHKKTGARVVLISNDDENKVFYIGFRTTPKDSTGAPHIVEHTVLCGSDKYPLKDPFVELCKGSLNTFLNAMTYPDKTLYPVASMNDKDFQNLMEVYLDAVFNPNIHKNEAIFLQEGWHYELNDDKLDINGVVYSEMKGAYSSDEDILYREIQTSLFPDNTYGVVSGGEPTCIPTLTYEDFCAFHKKYYHPSNSYIYLYGNMDMDEKLKYIDENYLSHYDYLEVDSEILPQKPFTETKKVYVDYPVLESDEGDKTHYSLNSVFPNTLDKELYVAMNVLDYCLVSSSGAPIKYALTKKGIGTEIFSYAENGIKQPVFSIIAKNAADDKEEEFLSTIREELEKIVKNGFDKKALLAAVNVFEFKYKEADFGRFPKGLMYGINMLDSWLYDDSKPFIHIEANDTFKALKEKIDTGYFEGLVEKYILNNPHSSVVVLNPKKGLQEERDAEFAALMEEKRKSLSDADIAVIKEKMEKLNAFRDTPDSPENLECLPMLAREDLKRDVIKSKIKETEYAGVKTLVTDVYTNGIGYMLFSFDLSYVPVSNIKYIGLMREVLGLMDTDNYSYQDLCNEVNLYTGGINMAVNTYRKFNGNGEFARRFEVSMKFLKENFGRAVGFAEEQMLRTKLNDAERMLEIIEEVKSQMQGSFVSSGHSLAMHVAESRLFRASAYSDYISGYEFYKIIDQYSKELKESPENIINGLEETIKMVFAKENLQIVLTGDEEMLKDNEMILAAFVDKLYSRQINEVQDTPDLLSDRSCALITPGQVNYVCVAGDYSKYGLEYNGALMALKTIMGYGYLWENVRVKGGAYGCMGGTDNYGRAGFVSYRDPNLTNTIKIFREAADYVRTLELDEKSMVKNIIGAVGEIDIPFTPKGFGSFSYGIYMTKTPEEARQKTRNQLLDCTAEDIKGVAPFLDCIKESDVVVVVGTATDIKNNSDLFESINPIF